MPKRETLSTANSIVQGVIIAVVSGCILGLLGYFVPGMWAWFKEVVLAGWGYFCYLFFYPFTLPAWFTLPILIFAGYAIDRLLPQAPDGIDDSPEWRAYVTDEFFGIRWRWGYQLNGEIRKPTPFCIHDQMQLDFFDHRFGASTYFKCGYCQRQIGPIDGGYGDVLLSVAKQIQRKLHTGEWEQVVIADSQTPSPE